MKELIITLKAKEDKWDYEEVKFKVKEESWFKKLLSCAVKFPLKLR